MATREEEKNILSGVLGTVALHLIIIIVLLLGRINKIADQPEETIVIELSEEVYKSLDNMIEEVKLQKMDQLNISPLSKEEVSNIAVNTANKLDQEISTEKYINQVKGELGITELNQQLDRSLEGDEDIAVGQKKESKPTKRVEFKGRTTSSVFLENRNIRHQEIPVYRCEKAGVVILDIVVNPDGEVISAVIKATNSSEECINQSALNAARLFLFSYKADAEPRQKGTITFEFFAQ